MQVEVRLLGGFAVLCDGATALDARWRPAKAAAIVKILALQRDRALHRDRLIDILWPNADAESGSNSLYKNLHQLREALSRAGAPRDTVRLDHGLLSLSPDVRVDVEDFRAAAQSARREPSDETLSAALHHYMGDLLPDEPYEEYAALAREETRTLALLLRLRFGELLLDHRQLEAANEQFREALNIDPASEEAHRGLMRAHDAGGRRELALRQYERCVEELAKDLGAMPSPETRALADQIRHAGSDQEVVQAAVDEPERLGDEARRAFAWADACAHYREAIDRLHAAGRDDLREAKLWMKLADATVPIATNADVPEYCRRAIDLARSAGSFETFAKAVLRFQDATDMVPGNNAGHREAAQLIEAALEEAPPGDSAGKALLLAASGRPLAAATRPNGSRHVTGRSSVAGERDPAIEQRLRDAVDMARRVGDRNVLAIAITRCRNYIVSPDTLPERLELSREMVAVTTEPNHLRWEFEAHLFRQEDLLEVGDIDGARIEARAMRRLGESLKSDAILAVAWSMQATHDIADGALAEANRTLFQSLELDQKVGMNSNAPSRHLIQLLMLRWHEGRIGELEDDLRRIVDRVPEDASMRALLALIYAETDRLEAARLELQTIVEQQPLDRIPRDHLWWLTMVAMSHVAGGTESTAIARDLYACVLPYAARNAATWSAISFGAASLWLARLAASLGDVTAAEQHYEAALVFNDHTRQRTWAARTRYHFAQLLVLQGSEQHRARELARVALADAVELGMAQLKLQCEALLGGRPAAPADVRYTTTADGVRIAYTDEGEGAPLIHMSQLPWNHLQRELDLPQWRAWHAALGAGRRYIRYDGRGRGLSDREGHAIAVETEVRDLEAVVDALQLDQFDLYSGIQSSMTALSYAARHPGKVRKLALWLAYAGNTNLMNSPLGRAGRAMSEAEYTAHCEFAGNITAGHEHPEASRTIAAILQDSANPDLVDTWVSEPYLNADVTELLPDVRCPVLLFDHRGFPIELNTAADLAIVRAGLPDTHVVVRSTPSYTPFMDDLDECITAVRGFFDGPVVRYTTTTDGVRIAYSVTGCGDATVLRASSISGSHLLLRREYGAVGPTVEALEERVRFVEYDGRGSGMSERGDQDFSLDARVRDIEAVVEAASLDVFVLWGAWSGGPAAIAYAAKHPERVSHLILDHVYPNARDYYALPAVRSHAGLLPSTDEEWDFYAASQAAWEQRFFSEVNVDERTKLLRESIDAVALRAFRNASLELDVSALLLSIEMPVLVTCRASEAYGQPEQSAAIAKALPNARLAALPRTSVDAPGPDTEWLEAVVAFLEPPSVPYAKTSDGVRIAYTDEGQGRPLVHLSQLPWNHIKLEREMPEWNAWHAALAEGRRYIRYDGRGRGLSDRARTECTIETEIRDLLAVVDTLQLQEFDLFVGIAGSLTALRFAAEHPGRVRRLVLWAPITSGDAFMHPSLREQAAERMLQDWQYFCQFVIHTTLQFKGRHDEELCERMAKLYESSATPEFARGMLNQYLAEDISDSISGVVAPSLILFDQGWAPAVPHAGIESLRNQLPGAVLKLVDGGCFPFTDEYADTIAAIRDFLDAPVASGAGSEAAGA